MKIALAQINTTVGDLKANTEKILGAYNKARSLGADLVLAPELAITGYPPRDLLCKPHFVQQNLQMLETLARATDDQTALLAGYVDLNTELPGRSLFNSAALLGSGKILARAHKSLLPTYDVFDEDRYFEPSKKVTVATWKGKKLGLSICEDLWNDPDFWTNRRYVCDPGRDLVQAGSELLLNISASPYELGKELVRFNMLQTLAKTERVPVLYCNLLGGNDELIFDGNSLAFNAHGELIGQGLAFQEDLILIDLHQAPGRTYESRNRMENLHDALVLGLKDYIAKCGFKSVVLGLSGGIDSAVTACLAVEAVGRENVLGVLMPSMFSSEGSVADARRLAENLAIRHEIIPISAPFLGLKNTLADIFKGTKEDLTEENLQSRTRGQILMALSNKFGHLVLTTGNKSELAVGYCTLYGDMCGGLAVISDVPKTVIYDLARWINRKGEVIPEASITKPPSAELRPNQTDQDSLPPYEVLDAILRAYVEEHKSMEQILAELKFDRKVVQEVIRKIDFSEYKRRQAAPGLKVTSKAFGIGRRMPIAQRFREF